MRFFVLLLLSLILCTPMAFAGRYTKPAAPQADSLTKAIEKANLEAAKEHKAKSILRCTECGRTPEEVAKHGHPHKPPYIFQEVINCEESNSKPAQKGKEEILKHSQRQKPAENTVNQEERCPECGRLPSQGLSCNHK